MPTPAEKPSVRCANPRASEVCKEYRGIQCNKGKSGCPAFMVYEKKTATMGSMYSAFSDGTDMKDDLLRPEVKAHGWRTSNTNSESPFGRI